MLQKSPDQNPNRVALGLALMAIAMLLIPVLDGTAKYLTASYSAYFISWARYVMATIVILPIALAIYRGRILPSRDYLMHFLRTAFLVSAMTSYFVALETTALATAIAAFFVSPILATGLAVLVLKEKLTARKIIGLVLGLAGALLILRPTVELEFGILLALASGAFFALYMVTTRLTSQSTDPVKTLVFQCIVGALLLTPQAAFTWEWPTLSVLPFFLMIGVLSVTCHLLSIAAFRYAEASTLAPMVYLELVSGSVIGYVVFGDFPALIVWFGAALIVIGGLVVLERKSSC